MRDMLLTIAPLVAPVSGSLLALASVTLVLAIWLQEKKPLRDFFLGATLAFIVILFVFGCFGVAVTMMTVKEAIVAGGS